MREADVEDSKNRETAKSLGLLPALPASLMTDLLEGEIAAAGAYRRRAKADNTIRAYKSDWRQFAAWCEARGLEPLPARAEAVATYLASLAQAGKADSTIGRHLAAIGWRHRQAGEVPPTARDARMVIAETLAGIRREQRARPSAKKAAISAVDLAEMISVVRGIGSKAIRDRAILALGLASALRRSELVALQLADVRLVQAGARLTIRTSKTDQEGEGQCIAIPNGSTILPVARLKAWLAVRGEAPGPLFTRAPQQGPMTLLPMSDRSIARIVQKYAALAGLDAATLAAHSLRAGFLTEAARTGASLPKMQEVSRQKKLEVLLGYIRSAELFDDHAGEGFL
jgi:site-specific recombinase XerD